MESWRQIREGDENAEIIYMERWILLQNLSRTMNCWLDKGIATHSTVLAWRIPWTEEPDGLYSQRSLRLPTALAKVTISPGLGRLPPEH